MKKVERAAQLMASNDTIFACPVCQSMMTVKGTTITCYQGHHFDLAKKGYANLYTQSSPADYDKTLFESRYQVIQAGLYDELHRLIQMLIQENSSKDDFTVLDAGCGEGSHVSHILQPFEQVTGIGLDIAKDGIMTAAKYHSDCIWCVGDLANSPFQSNQFDVILNLLSPANYQDFHRILQPEGMVIKVVPQQNYLKEIRSLVFDDSQQSHNNRATIDQFKQQYRQVVTHRLQYTRYIDPDIRPDLLTMTPLTWHHRNSNQLEKWSEQFDDVTIDLDILIGIP
ncbi:rRNA (guanine-N(1)-)-methyltransferase [Gracilibacillus halophilus YIM-C55.5]|uniref:rRNA (Guanine-N(1)-)-methyltransferase n=1 Tax=Gracilibacillus halophilus YIM-C55.5 TaxID=1308866 RepID=N4WFH8_9BACI|nr:methyltransferase domain-containing protein [Gracilibacillus halophilus]ENH98019.1 rRNA (guanine-N(1)-)-methyltransferase [Gracilibacillus halophilus YIM-C55.5]